MNDNTPQSNISSVPAERTLHSAGIYYGGCNVCQAPHRQFFATVNAAALFLKVYTFNPFYARRVSLGIVNIFKKGLYICNSL